MLYRFQDRPYLRIPQGATVWFRAPRGLTIADMHNSLRECSHDKQARSAFCVPGASLRVDRRGGYYVAHVTSDDRSTALEIQRRARQP
jgi:hypothetical protein